jgi:hypothetical protein
MTAFAQRITQDLRTGRQSWPVLLTFTSASFVIAVATALLRTPF